MPKLDVNAISYLTRSEEESFRRELLLCDESAKAILERLRIEGVPRPVDTTGGEGPTPIEIDKLDALTNDQLGALFIEYTGWAQFLRVETAKKKAEYLAAKSVLKRLAIKLKKTLIERGFSKELIMGEIQNIPFYEEIAIEVDKQQISSELLDAYRAAFSNNADALSRIITLRGQEYETGRRANYMGNYKRGQASALSTARQKVAKAIKTKGAADDDED